MSLDRLIDVAVECWHELKPFEIVRMYERGVQLRGGEYRRTLGPGTYFKIPIYDTIHTDNVVTRTKEITGRPLETADGVTVQVSGILRFSINDVKKALLEVEGVDDATRDISCLVMADAIQRNTYDTVRSANFAEVLTKAARKRGWRYGIEVEELGLDSVSRSSTLVVVNPNGSAAHAGSRAGS